MAVSTGSAGRVYHASRVQGLRVILPRRSTRGESWVYACPDPAMAAVFVSPTGGDLTCQVGRDPQTGKPYVCERFAGAFRHRYEKRGGSIYALRGDTFEAGGSEWEEEVVSPVEVIPLAETTITDASSYLLGLARQGRLLIVRHPDRIDGIPLDNHDLVDKVASWVRVHGREVLAAVRAYHPELVDRVIEKLNEPV